jgi:hypothetical protein
MNFSMNDYLRVITPHLHTDLVSPAATSQLQSLAQVLPPLSLAGLECRLGAEQSRVDLQVNLPRCVLNLPERYLAHPVWQFLQKLCHEWVMPSSLLHQTVRNMVLEFDVNEEPSQIPMPCIFWGLNSEVRYDADTLIELALQLSNSSVSSPLASNLQHCIDALPVNAGISHLGAMLSRSAQGVRVNVRGITSEQIPNYLAQIGWSDQSHTLSTLVSTLPELTDSILLSFDVGDLVHSRVGLECFFNKQPQDEPLWKLFLDQLVIKGLCTETKRNALLAWGGFSQKSATPDLWPSNIDWGDRFLGARAVSLFWRRLNHIKLVYQPGCPLEAKAYLAFGHGWFDPNILTQTPQPQLKRRVPA